MNLQQEYEAQMEFNSSVKDFLKIHFNHLIDDQAERIISFINRKNYLQLLYTWGPELLQGLLDHFLREENYDQCILIRDTVNNHNKATGEQIKLQS
jgi:hypothetical protein